MESKVEQYMRNWRSCGYPSDIPDEVPDELRRENLAPSYKAIALAILRCDHSLQSLGFSPGMSLWYSELKRIELSDRQDGQMRLF